MNEKPLWSAVALDADAEPIRILDLDVARTTWSRVHESMRVVHLKLSRQPAPQWIRFFHEERESRINPRRAGLWIEDAQIAFDCLLDDVEKHHLPDIRRSVAFANERMQELLAARVRERGAQQAADRDERRALERLRQRVRDGVDPRPATSPTPAPAAPAPVAAEPPAARPAAAPRSLDATLDAYRAALREARERARGEAAAPPKKTP